MKSFDEERALYGARDILVEDCNFDGPADAESAFKEGRGITVKNCFFNLRYPFWHDDGLKITESEMTELCRAALWYSQDIEITNTKLHGIKALHECGNIRMNGCDIISPEFGWSVQGIDMEDCTVVSIKNPLSGHICVPDVGEIIMDIPDAKGEIIMKKQYCCA